MNTLTDIKNKIAAISLLVLVSGCGGGDSSMKNIADGFDFDILPVQYDDGGYTHTGYMNSDGELVIDFGNYCYLACDNGLFRDGLAYVNVEQSGLNGFINKEGELVIDLTGYSNKAGKYFSEGLYLTDNDRGVITAFNPKGEIEWEAEGYIRTQLRGGYALFQEHNSKYRDDYGVINSKGEVCFMSVAERNRESDAYIPSDYMWLFSTPAGYAHPSYFPISNGYDIIYILDVSTGKHILEGMLDPYDTNLLAVDCNNLIVVSADEKYGIIDCDGNVVVDIQYKRLINDGKWYVFMENGRWGWIDKDGEVVIPAEFKCSHIPLFGPSDWCRIDEHTFINRKGEIVLETEYEALTNFIGDRCLVKVRTSSRNYTHSWMNRDGELIGGVFPVCAESALNHLSCGRAIQYVPLLF